MSLNVDAEPMVDSHISLLHDKQLMSDYYNEHDAFIYSTKFPERTFQSSKIPKFGGEIL